MVELLKTEYWSKSKAFLLPLTGMRKTSEFEVTSYLKWGDFSIENYQLIIKVEYGHRYTEFLTYLQESIISDAAALVTEVYDYEGFSIVIFDLSEWSTDINNFLKGKYSRLSMIAKRIIQDYHIFGDNKINIGIWACLYPNSKEECIDNMTGIEYAIKHYVMVTSPPSRKDLETAHIWRTTGEICSICDIEKETLELEVCQSDITLVPE